MHTTMKVIVVLIILLIAFIILVGLMVGWAGESQSAMGDIFGFLKGMLPGGSSTTANTQSGGGTTQPSGTTPTSGTTPKTQPNDVHGIKDVT